MTSPLTSEARLENELALARHDRDFAAALAWLGWALVVVLVWWKGAGCAV